MASCHSLAENSPRSMWASRMSISAAQAASLSESKSSGSRLSSRQCAMAARSVVGNSKARFKISFAVVMTHRQFLESSKLTAHACALPNLFLRSRHGDPLRRWGLAEVDEQPFARTHRKLARL